jgi:hypothetical protein
MVDCWMLTSLLSSPRYVCRLYPSSQTSTSYTLTCPHHRRVVCVSVSVHSLRNLNKIEPYPILSSTTAPNHRSEASPSLQSVGAGYQNKHWGCQLIFEMLSVHLYEQGLRAVRGDTLHLYMHTGHNINIFDSVFFFPQRFQFLSFNSSVVSSSVASEFVGWHAMSQIAQDHYFIGTRVFRICTSTVKIAQADTLIGTRESVSFQEWTCSENGFQIRWPHQ